MSRDFRLYLDDICTACEKILRYTTGLSREQFVADEKTFDAVIRNFEIMGEASKQLPEKIRTRYSQIEWSKIAGLRDVAIHHYFGVDEDILWKTIQNEIPPPLLQVREILAHASDDAEWVS